MIDLRSDTVTKPTAAMREVIANADVGDDVFGEDPAINILEHKIAEMFGKEAGLFVPSGTMSNQIALHLLTRPGDEVICDETAHIYNYESGAAGYLSGIQLCTIPGKFGIMEPAAIEAAIRPKNDWDPRTSVISLENTANKGGGSCYSEDQLKSIKEIADNNGLHIHLDGARIWNAMVATGMDAEFFGSIAETISVCFSKGLGAPVGSMLLGSNDMIKRGRRVRKMLGGGMRQAGLLAAAAEYAVEHHFKLLKEDHRRAREVGQVIAECPRLKIDQKRLQTNIVIFDVIEDSAINALARLENEGIKMVPFGPKTIRATFHLEITDDDIITVKSSLKKLFA